MFAGKRVIVVYPDEYEDVAIILQHEISKLDGFDSAAWTIEHYKQNCPTLSARSYVIFLGNAEENPYSKVYLPQIDNLVNIQGACYGRDGSKAVVFGEGKLEQKAALEALASKQNYALAGAAAATSNAALLARSFIISAPLSVLAGWGYWKLSKHSQRKKAQKELRFEQTKLAVYKFILTELEPWTETGA